MTLMLNIFGWISVHLSISFMTSTLSDNILLKSIVLFQPLKCESDGNLYTLLKIKVWKNLLPDAGGWFRSGVKKNEIGLSSYIGRQTFLRELNRAEISHWLQMLPAPLFFILNSGTLSWTMFLYGIFFNLPLILVQRYNRIRLLSLIQHSISTNKQEAMPPSKLPIIENDTKLT
ncbi:glycosyl-4,4'-diaponeurosporenoate acyltransferase CrtO family protein [Rossellomorea arthrocnemi]|uniref:glycosyl-4,4'-diaponeurosporenoate acyltransferase CrtO family protein n=1 Tax=Rossellomorea arthrocnemi TaxID=2769542 RepID=UPI0019189E32|nr:hypothetical protein [Rossellomorea arthrocnemi]